MTASELINFSSDVVPFLRLGREYQDGITSSLQSHQWDFYVVANFNMIVEPGWCTQRLNMLDIRIARELLGRNWCRKPNEARPFWIGIPEQATWLHYNLLWRMQPALRTRFCEEAPKIWKLLVPSGSLHIRDVREGNEDNDVSASYTAKTFHPKWSVDHLIVSTVLRRPRTT